MDDTSPAHRPSDPDRVWRLFERTAAAVARSQAAIDAATAVLALASEQIFLARALRGEPVPERTPDRQPVTPSDAPKAPPRPDSPAPGAGVGWAGSGASWGDDGLENHQTRDLAGGFQYAVYRAVSLAETAEETDAAREDTVSPFGRTNGRIDQLPQGRESESDQGHLGPWKWGRRSRAPSRIPPVIP